jgi:hypothetical protein
MADPPIQAHFLIDGLAGLLELLLVVTLGAVEQRANDTVMQIESVPIRTTTSSLSALKLPRRLIRLPATSNTLLLPGTAPGLSRRDAFWKSWQAKPNRGAAAMTIENRKPELMALWEFQLS